MNCLNKHFVLFLTLNNLLLISCNNQNNNAFKIYAFGADVASTKSVLETTLYEGIKYEYVISSYPVINRAKTKNTNIKVIEDIKKKYNEKYNFNGFPQAGLFINTKIENDDNYDLKIKKFLNVFDNRINLLINNDISNYDIINDYSSDFNEQTKYFGFNSNDLNEVLNDNKLSFIYVSNNPDINELLK